MSWISLDKIRGSVSSLARQGASLVQSVKKAATNSSGSDPSERDAERPERELTRLAKDLYRLIDQLAVDKDAHTYDADTRLSQSPARHLLKRIVNLIEQDSHDWLRRQRRLRPTCPHDDLDNNVKDRLELDDDNDARDSLTPCIDNFLHSNMTAELCDRAILDTPRGMMPLVLSCLSSLLRSCDYPLVPHTSVYKPIARLIFVAARYDGMVADEHSAAPEQRDRHSRYRRRIDIGLTSLLRTIWRKITENPPSLDYFIVSERR